MGDFDLVVGIASIATAIVVLSGAVIAARAWWHRKFDWRQLEYRKLRALRAGMSIDLYDSVLGPATFIRARHEGEVFEKTYRGRDYWVQAVYDPVGEVKLMSVTACSEQFQPDFQTPYGRFQLNSLSMACYGDKETGEAYYWFPGATANVVVLEKYFGGNPSLYKTFFLGLNDACPESRQRAGELMSQQLNGASEYHGPCNADEIQQFRNKTVPNLYGETSPSNAASLNDITTIFQVGVDRILIRTE